MRLLALSLCLLACSTQAVAADSVAVRAIKGEFAEVRDRVAFAVESQGLVVDHTSRVGDMLERTGKDLGAGRPIFGDAEVLEFCSALTSRRMVEADVSLLAYCPYGIAVYTLPDDPMTTYVAYRLVTAGAADAHRQVLEQVERLLFRIVEEAAF